jgi:hypothetical protein
MQKPSIGVKSGGLRSDPDRVPLDHTVLALRAGARTYVNRHNTIREWAWERGAGTQRRVHIVRLMTGTYGNIMLIARQRAVTYASPRWSR